MKLKSIFASAIILLPAIAATTALVLPNTYRNHSEYSMRMEKEKIVEKKCCVKPKPKVEGCVFKTIMGEEKNLPNIEYKVPENIAPVIESALQWMSKAQLNDGGWGAGFNAYQQILDPHKVPSDPASTAMVCMALLRTQNTLQKGKYKTQLQKGTDFLINAVLNQKQNNTNITNLTGTQPQVKLGANIDVVLTAQYFSNLLNYVDKNSTDYSKVKNALQSCTNKIQNAQASNGSFQGNGWAGVLQSSFANNALESAKIQGINIDDNVLEKSREYQKKNYDAESGNVNTDLGAGVVLYSVSSSGRATAQESRKAKETIEQAKKEGKLKKDEDVNTENLRKAGMAEDEALRYATAYKINTSASNKAQQSDVLQGFGNNGGEEFLSFLQTGEGLVIAKDNNWKNWYDNTSGKLVSIQNQDGSWNGHHCITSPVFCTATCLLVLAIQNDIEHLQK